VAADGADRVPSRLALRVAVSYAAGAATWIVASSAIGVWLTPGVSNSLTTFEVLKGLAFVLVTALMLYALIRRVLRDLRLAQVQRISTLQRLSAITATMPDALIVCSSDGDLEYANEVAYRLLGLNAEHSARQTHQQLCVHLVDSDGQPFADGDTPFDRAKRAGTPIYGMEARVNRGDRPVFLRLNVSSVRNAAGEMLAMVATFTDVTRERESSAALARAQRALTVLSTSSSTPMRSGGDSVCLEACRALTTLGGYQFAWVGTPEDGPERALRLRAEVGMPAELLKAWIPRWGVSDEQYPLEIRAHREGRAVVLAGSELAQAAGGWPKVAYAQGLRAIIAVPIQAHDRAPLGILALGSSSAEAFTGEELALLGILANQLAQALLADNAPSERDHALMQLRRIVDGSVRTIQAVVELRDPYTVGHEERVAQLAVTIARRLGLPDGRVQALEIAARLHDLGKAVVPTDILSKPGRLNPQEMALVRTHVDVGYRILREAGFPENVAEIVRQHHERLDGSGYPRGIKGDALWLEARILAVADVAESMATHRPYRAARGLGEAILELSEGRGVRFEPEVVDECIELLDAGFLDDGSLMALTSRQ
jgi:putative nucleotidyltransferase with HDIG domain/PAS domain S-box-containing protein